MHLESSLFQVNGYFRSSYVVEVPLEQRLSIESMKN